MTTYIPGAETSILPAIQGMGDHIAKLLAPNADFQRHMQKMLGDNPELVQKFADVEVKAPGTLAKLGFGGLGDTITQTPESAQSILDRTTKPAQVAAGKSKVAADTGKSDLSAIESQAIMKFMGEHPDATLDFAEKTVTGSTAAEKKAAAVDLNLRTQASNLGETRAALIKTLPDLGTVDFYEQARKFKTGHGVEVPVAAYNASPEASKAWVQGLRAYDENQRLEEMKLAHKMAKHDLSSDRLAARQSQNAYLQYSKSGNAGTVDTWESFMYDPKAQQRASDLTSGKIKSSGFEDDNLIAVATAAQKSGVARFNPAIVAINGQIVGTIKKLDMGVPDEERPRLIGELNEQLTKRNTMGGPKIKAVWRDVKWGFDKMEYVDEKGNVLSTDKVEEMLTTPATERTLSQPAQTALTRIKALDSTSIQAGLAKYRASDPSPGQEDSKGVEEELRRLGAIK